MSQPLFSDDVEFYQRLLSCAGLYNGPINGQWDQQTDQADQQFAAVYDSIKAKLGAFDPRSEGNIRTLLPATQEASRQFLGRVARNFPNDAVRIISGSRTYATQDALYQKGRTTSGDKVTNARAGQSNHNFGIAWDIGIFDGGRYLTGNSAGESKVYKDLAAITLDPSLEWGGEWTTFVDLPHYQMKVNSTLKQVRQLFETGKKII